MVVYVREAIKQFSAANGLFPYSAPDHFGAMNASLPMNPHNEHLKRLARWVLIMAFAWSAVVGYSLYSDVQNERDGALALARNTARDNFFKDQAFRLWASSKGGLYALVDEHTQPVPFMSHVVDRDIKTVDGRHLTLMNPASMLREMMDQYADLYGIKGRIVGNVTLNPANRADAWESKAIRAFERGEKEVFEVSDINGRPHVRLIRPMIMQQPCMKCHGHLGFGLGAVRGAVGVAVPLDEYLGPANERSLQTAYTHGAIWLIGLVGGAFFYRKQRGGILEREKTLADLILAARVFDDSLQGIAITDPNGAMLRVNKAFSEITGFAAEEVIGRNLSLIKADAQAALQFDEVWRQFQSQGKWQGELCGLRKNGERYAVSESYSTVHDEGGRPLYCINLFQDITERKRTETALRESESRWQYALEGAGTGVWDWNVATNELYLAPGLKAQLGYQDHELANEFSTWETRVHPDDLPRVMAEVTEYFEGRRPDYDVEYRMRSKSGEYIWIRARGKVMAWSGEGKPLRMLGVHDDVTDRKRAELALENRIVALTRPLDSTETINFTELINLKDIQHLQELFADAFGVASLITTPEGVPITQPSNFSRLCGQMIRTNSEGTRRCEHSDAILGRYNPNGPNIQHCLSAGLCNAGASITVGGRHVANWLIGQVRDESHHEGTIVRFAREIGANESDMVEAFREVPTMPKAHFEKVARILFAVANQISTMAYQNIQQARFIAERKRAEEDLLKSEARYREAQHTASLGHWSFDVLNERFQWWSEETFRLLGLDPSQGAPDYAAFIARVHAEDREKVNRIVEHSISSGEPFVVIYRVPQVDGGMRYLEARGEARRGEDGQVGWLNGTVMDVTVRQLAEERLLTFQALAEASFDAIIMARPEDAALTYANRAAHEMFGCDYDEREMHGQSGSCFWALEDRDLMAEVIRQALAGGWSGDVRQRHNDGTLFDANATVFAIGGTEGRPLRIVAIIRDISARKQAEKALRDNEARLSLALSASRQGLFDLDLSSGKADLTHEYAVMLGYNPEHFELDIRHWLELLHPEDRAQAAAVLAACETGATKDFSIEFRMATAEGDWKWIRSSGQVIDWDAAGKPRRLVGTHMDIEESKEAEEALRIANSKLESIIDFLPDATFVVDESGRVIAWNHAIERMSGVAKADILGKADRSYAEAFYGTRRPMLIDLILQNRADEGPSFYQAFERDGEMLTAEGVTPEVYGGKGAYIWAVALPLRDSRGNVIGAIECVRDITESKRAENALRQNEERLRLALEGASDGIWDWDFNTGQTYFSPRYYTMLGYEPDEFPANLENWRALLHPDDLPGAEADIQAYIQGKGESYATEFRCRTKDGGWRWILGRGKVVEQDAQGRPLRLAGSHTDITDRKEVENRLRLTQFAVEHASDAVFWFDHAGCFSYVNEQACRMLGYGRDELARMCIPDVDVNIGVEKIQSVIAALVGQGSIRLETELRRKDGGLVPVEISGQHITFDGQEHMVAHVRDVSARRIAEDALRVEKHFSDALINSLPGVFYLFDENLRLLRWNKNLSVISGYPEDGLAGKHVADFIAEGDRGQIAETIQTILRDGDASAEAHLLTAGGERIPYYLTGLRMREGERVYIVGSGIDITERRRAEEALRLIRFGVERSSDAVFLIDQESRFLDVNEAACVSLGYARDELLTMSIMDIDPEVSTEALAASFNDLRGKGRLHLETRHRRRDGTTYPVEIMANYIDFGGREYNFCYARDISERKKAEAALHLTRSAIDEAAMAFEWFDDTGRVIDVNLQSCKELGYSREELLELRLCDIDPNFPAERWPEVWSTIKRDGTISMESVHRCKDGGIFPVQITGSYVEFDGREYVFSYAQNITERRRAEEILRLTQFAIDHSSAAFEWLDMDGRVVACNLQACQSLGYTREEFIGLHVPDFSPGATEAHWRVHVDSLRRDGHALFEAEHRRKDGSVFPVEIRANFVRFGDKEYIFSYINDITERKRSEETLRLTQFAIDHSSVAFEWLSAEGEVIASNIEAPRALGYSKEEFVGLRVWDYDPEFSPARWQEFWAELKREGSVTVETRHRRKDGSTFPIEVTANHVRFGDKEFCFAYITDISKRKEAEQALLELNATLEGRVHEEVAKNRDKDHLLIQQSRLAAMGEMMGNIAHQWRQPINALSLVLANIKDAYEFDQLDRDYLDGQVERGGNLIHKMSTTIDDFRSFFRPDRTKQAFSLARALRDAMMIVELSYAHAKIALEVEPGEDVVCFGFPNEYAQVVLNLLGNAKDAIVERNIPEGRVTIRMERSGRKGRLILSDNGGGIAEDVLPKVFDPYFTTRDKGTGIGLYMSRMIIENMGGRITVANANGGVRVTLSTPLAQSAGPGQ